MRPRTVKVVSIILSLIVSLTVLLGYDLVYDRQVVDDPASLEPFGCDMKPAD